MNSIGDIVTVDDAHTEGTKVPAIVTAVSDDGSVNLTVFGTSDVVEKRHGVTLDTDDEPDDDTDDDVNAPESAVAASGKRAKPATVFSEEG